MVVAKESYACINYITLFLQELLHQRIGFCTKVIYYAPKSGSSLNCIVFSSVIDPPYNTGNDFVYNDTFVMSQEESDIAEGTIDEWGERFSANVKTSNRYHASVLYH